MKKVLLLYFFCFACLPGRSQAPKVVDKMFNFGAKIGLNSTLPAVNSISINDIKAENVSYQYKVGISAAAFCRINIDHFFLQPSLAWVRTSGEIYFQIPVTENETSSMPADSKLKYNISSIEAPVLIGYKIVKEDPYGLSIIVGPNFKYSYKIRYSANFAEHLHEYESDSTPWGIGIIGGVGVSIGRLFFDVTYEIGLNKVDSDFKEIHVAEKTKNNISIDRHTNMLSFSLGFLF